MGKLNLLPIRGEHPVHLDDKALLNLLGRVVVRETYANKVGNPFAAKQHADHKRRIIKECDRRGLRCG